MTEDPPDLRFERSPLRGPQAFYLLREVFPVERKVRATGAAQRRRLVLGPEQEVLIVKLICLGHLMPPSSDMMGLGGCVRKRPSRRVKRRHDCAIDGFACPAGAARIAN